MEVSKWEKEAWIIPDPDTNSYIKVFYILVYFWSILFNPVGIGKL